MNLTNIATNFCTHRIYGFLCCSRYSIELSEYPVTNFITDFPMERLFKSLLDISLFFIYFSHLHIHLRTVKVLWERFLNIPLKVIILSLNHLASSWCVEKGNATRAGRAELTESWQVLLGVHTAGLAALWDHVSCQTPSQPLSIRLKKK